MKTVPIDTLIFAEYNPRLLTEDQGKVLKDSITRFGVVDPIIVNSNSERKNIVIGGHQRLKIAKLLGIKEVPIVEVDLTRDRERELNIRLNKNTGDWDWDLLANHFDTDELLEWGFSENELQFFENEDSEGNTDPDAVPELVEQKTKTGDLYQLGDHRLLCGDATKREDVERLMNGRKADMVFTDPPYGVSYSDKNSFLNEFDKGNCIQKEIDNDHKSEVEIKIFWKSVFEILRDNLSETNSYYIFGPQIQGMMMMMMMMMEAGLPYRHVIIWVKNNHVLGRCDYNYKHEPLFFGWTSKHKFYGGGEFKTSVWEVDKPYKSDLHPTMKPIRIIKNALLNSSLKDQICLDPFLGSGSTLIACEQTQRICYGLEIDPHYCDVIVKRWEDFKGKEAKKIE